MRSKAIFLDRDGTLNEMVYNENHGIFDSPMLPSQLKVIAGSTDLVNRAKELGYKVIIISNQPGIAKGTLTIENLKAINNKLLTIIGIDKIDDIFFCPHHPDGLLDPQSKYIFDCECRKPKPGMLLEAAKKHDIELSNSWMIGDGITDVQAGVAAGCKTMLIANIKVEHLAMLEKKSVWPEIIVPNIYGAINHLNSL